MKTLAFSPRPHRTHSKRSSTRSNSVVYHSAHLIISKAKRLSKQSIKPVRIGVPTYPREIPTPHPYDYACKLYDEGAAVLPFKNSNGGMLTVKGAREEAREFNAPGNMLSDFRAFYECEPDGWAVLTGPNGYIVIDCEDDETFRIASKRFPYTRKTFGSKGGHIHLRVDGSVDRRQHFKNGHLLFEVLSNWMVTLPGSIHRKTGKPYVLLEEAPLQRITLWEFERQVRILCRKIGARA